VSELFVSALTLSHFRSHKLTRIHAENAPVVLYGPNGAGKTNVIEAISLLSPGRGLRGAKAADMARQPEALGWKIKADLTSLNQAHEVETGQEGDASRTVRIDDKTAAQTALGRIARIVWLVPMMDRLWMEGATERRRFLDRLTLSFEPSHAASTLAYEKAMRQRNRLLKDGVRNDGWYQALEGQMAENGAAINANRALCLARLQAAQTGAQTSFPAADLELIVADNAENPATQTELAAILAENRKIDLAAGRTLNGPHRADLAAIYQTKSTPARLCSTGEQKALLVSLILASARALKEDFGAPPILLLDEVAAHLDEDRRAALYDEICALKAQAWMTGTGAELFDAVKSRAQMIHVTEGDAGSQLTHK